MPSTGVAGPKGHPRPRTCGAQRASQPHRSPSGLQVERDAARAGLGVGRGPGVGVLDHQMAVHGGADMAQQRLDDGESQREVRHEVVVHHVDVQPIGGPFDPRALGGEVGEVRRQDAWRDLDAHGRRA